MHFSNSYTPKAMPKAAAKGYLDVVKWLHGYNIKGPVAKSIKKAAARGHLRLVKWLLPHCTRPSTLLSAMKLAIASENFEVILFLDAQLTDVYTENDLKEMRCHWFQYHDLQHWFDGKYPPSAEEAGSVSY